MSAPPAVRSDFRTTAFWQPDVITGPDGVATVTVRYPESLTAWAVKARAVSDGDRFGIGEARTRTSKPIAVRLHAPRFLVAGDEAIVSATVHNATAEPIAIVPGLTAEG